MKALPLFVAREVDYVRAMLPGRAPQLRNDRAQGGAVDVHEDQGRAFFREAFRETGAYAVCRAGDDHPTVLEIVHPILPAGIKPAITTLPFSATARTRSPRYDARRGR